MRTPEAGTSLLKTITKSLLKHSPGGRGNTMLPTGSLLRTAALLPYALVAEAGTCLLKSPRKKLLLQLSADAAATGCS